MTKNLLIIASNFQNTSTGGLIWINKLAQYAQKVYEKTIIIDLARLQFYIKNNRFLSIIYFTFFLLWRSSYFVFIDHSLHMRFVAPLLMSLFLKKNSYAVICHHLFHPLRTGFFRRKVEYLSEKILLKNAQIIIAPSKKTYLDIQKLGGDKRKIRIINPTYTFKSKEIPERKFGNKILYVGNLEPRKGLDVVIKALSLIKDTNFSCDIVGGYHKQQKYFSALKKLVSKYDLSNKIFFHGRISSGKVIDFYRNANIFVFPSRHEGYGIVLLEAMSFGLPIVATDIPTTRDIVKDDVNGYLCPIDDIMCINQSIKKLLSNRDLQMQMSERNFKTSQKFRSWDEVIQQTFYCLRPYLFKIQNNG